MSAETFPLCLSAERCNTSVSPRPEKGPLLKQLKTRPSQPGLRRVSVAGPWRGLAVGVVGGRIEVEVGKGGRGVGDRGLP